MYKRYLFLMIIVFTFTFRICDVNASSISYNLRIDKAMHFYETIVYNVKDSEIDRSGDYDFLTSVVNDKIYFDNNNEIEYEKTKQKTSDGYIVTLKHDYDSIFASKSRIVNECFSKANISNNTKGLKFTSSSPFFCSKRADQITINIISEINITSSNADVKKENTHTWNKVNDNFSLQLSTEMVQIENDPLDSYEDADDDESDTSNTVVSDDGNENAQDNTNDGVSKYVLMTAGFIFMGSLLIGSIVLIKRKNDINKL